jgi:hypothetical protein
MKSDDRIGDRRVVQHRPSCGLVVAGKAQQLSREVGLASTENPCKPLQAHLLAEDLLHDARAC